MAIKTEAIGKTYDAVTYTVGREKIREYANAVGADNPVHHDADAAKAAGYRAIVAPPMFCVVYSSRAVAPGIFAPEVGITFAGRVQGGQVFEGAEPVCAGDEI